MKTMMSTPMKKMLILMGILFGLLFGWYGVKKLFLWYMISHYEPPPVTVSSTVAKETTWQSYVTAVGTLTAINGVDISTEAAGIIQNIFFTSGQLVHKGDRLVQLNTDIEEAQLKFDESVLTLAKINYDRNVPLAKKNYIPATTLDELSARLQQAQANVEKTKALINQKNIVAPFDGKIGIRQVDLGQYISPGNSIVTLQSLDPLYVQFNLPEQYLHELYFNQPVDITVNLLNDLTVHGTIHAINAKVDQTTRNILAEAIIPNKNLAVYPGMFASVRIWLRAKNAVITLPQTAISYSLHGDSVFLIKAEKKGWRRETVYHVYRQYITTGERRGDDVVIENGLKAGDQVVTSGQLKLQNGTHVVIDNSIPL